MYKFLKILIILCFFFACESNKNIKKIIFVSIEPQKYFFKKICNEQYKIEIMIPLGHNPALYDPSPVQISKLKNALYYYQVGSLIFELNWNDKIRELNPELKIINTAKGIDLIKTGHVHTKSRYDNHFQGFDPHIWLSPALVRTQASNMYNSLIEINPELKLDFQYNYELFLKEIDEVDKYIINKFSELKEFDFIVYHPVLTYYARQYGLIQHCIEENGKLPGPKKIKSIIELAKKKNIKYILVQNEFDQNNAQVIAESINGKIININPLDENWKENIIFITDALYEILIKQGNKND